METEADLLEFLHLNRSNRPWLLLAEQTIKEEVAAQDLNRKLTLICQLLDNKSKSFRERRLDPNSENKYQRDDHGVNVVKKRKLNDSAASSPGKQTPISLINLYERPNRNLWQLAQYIVLILDLVDRRLGNSEAENTQRFCNLPFIRLPYSIQALIAAVARSFQLNQEYTSTDDYEKVEIRKLDLEEDRGLLRSSLQSRQDEVEAKIFRKVRELHFWLEKQPQEVGKVYLQAFSKYSQEFRLKQEERRNVILEALTLDTEAMSPAKRSIAKSIKDIRSLFKQVSSLTETPGVDQLEHQFEQILDGKLLINAEDASVIRQHHLFNDYVFLDLEEADEKGEKKAAKKKNVMNLIRAEVSKLEVQISKEEAARLEQEREAQETDQAYECDMRQKIANVMPVVDYLMSMEALAKTFQLKPSDPLSPFLILGVPFSVTNSTLKMIKAKVQLSLHPDKLGFGVTCSDQIVSAALKARVNYAFHLITESLKLIKVSRDNPVMRISYNWQPGRENPPYAEVCGLGGSFLKGTEKTGDPTRTKTTDSREDSSRCWYHSALAHPSCPSFQSNGERGCLVRVDGFVDDGITHGILTISNLDTKHPALSQCLFVHVGYPTRNREGISGDSNETSWIGEFPWTNKVAAAAVVTRVFHLHPLPIITSGRGRCYYPIGFSFFGADGCLCPVSWTIAECECRGEWEQGGAPIEDMQTALCYFAFSIPHIYPLKYDREFFMKANVQKMKKRAVISALKTVLGEASLGTS